ncbi:MAG: DUF4142 domain-containing protein [Gemmatimonadaceae bacterium]|nr:DUF4142 domain-containing protein [Gemmatimonadaceae bacterium]
MRPSLVIRHSLLGTLGMLALAGCRREPQGTATAPIVSDASVMAIVLAANNTDLSYARLAPARARQPEVLAFAQRMTTDHTLLNGVIGDLATKLRIAPEDHAISLDMRDESAGKRDVLRELSGRAFDSTYMANEIQYHRKLLVAIDSVLLPSARRPELHEFITALRPAVSAHLAHAEQTRAVIAARR